MPAGELSPHARAIAAADVLTRPRLDIRLGGLRWRRTRVVRRNRCRLTRSLDRRTRTIDQIVDLLRNLLTVPVEYHGLRIQRSDQKLAHLVALAHWPSRITPLFRHDRFGAARQPQHAIHDRQRRHPFGRFHFGRFDYDVRIPVLRKQVLRRHIGKLCRRIALRFGRRRKRRRRQRLHFQVDRILPRLTRLVPALPRLPYGGNQRGHQYDIQCNQLRFQNPARPFFSGTSFFATTPASTIRTFIVFSFGFPTVIRSS